MLFLKFPSLFSSAAPSRLSGFEQSAEELILPFAQHTAGALQILGNEEQPQPWAVPSAPRWCSVFSSAAAAFVRAPQQPHVTAQSLAGSREELGPSQQIMEALGLLGAGRFGKPPSSLQNTSCLCQKLLLKCCAQATGLVCQDAAGPGQEACQHYCPKTGWGGAARARTPSGKSADTALGADGDGSDDIHSALEIKQGFILSYFWPCMWERAAISCFLKWNMPEIIFERPGIYGIFTKFSFPFCFSSVFYIFFSACFSF